MSTEARAAAPRYSLWDLVRYALRLGTLGFGGPVALVGYMYRDLVEGRGWISEADYKEGLTLSQLAPGPLAAQLGMYLGYVDYHILGATLVGLAFILPSFLMVVALGWIYTTFGGLGWVQAVFYGVAASVIGIIAQSAYKLTTKTVGKDGLLWAIYLVTATTTVLTKSEPILLILGVGVLVWLVKAPPKDWWRRAKVGSFIGWPLSLALTGVPAAEPGRLWTIFLFFAKAGAFVFGSGLAIVPFLYGGVVTQFHWLTDKQFLDAVAVAMITPGPVVITSGFIGFLVAGLAGATVAALGTFLPPYLFTIALAPSFKKYGKRPDVAAFVGGVTSAATGAIAGSVIILGSKSIVDVTTGILALTTLGLVWKVKKLPEPFIVLGAAAIGLIVYPLVHR
jgi:chromate transporter